MIIPGDVFCRSWAARTYSYWQATRHGTATTLLEMQETRPRIDQEARKKEKRVGLRVGLVSILCNTEPCQHETPSAGGRTSLAGGGREIKINQPKRKTKRKRNQLQPARRNRFCRPFPLFSFLSFRWFVGNSSTICSQGTLITAGVVKGA